MAKLPAPEDYGVSSPRPSRGMTEISPVREVVDPKALTTGKVLMSIGDMMQDEANKLDETVALDALNQLQSKQLDLTYGDAGFTKVQGKGVIDRKITSEFPTQLQQEVTRLEGTIGSASARAKFQAQANNVVMGFKRGVYTHAAKETETFQQQTEDATVVTQAQAANLAARAGNVEAVAGAVATGRASVEAAVKRRGLEGPQADAYRQKELGVIHSDIINGLLDGGQPALAGAWLKNSLKEMTVAQADKFDARVKADTSWAAGDTFVREQLAAGKTTTEAEAALAAETKASGDKAKYDAGLHTLSTLNAARAKTYAENADKAQDEINKGTPWGKVRAKYLDTMDPSVVAAFDQRAKALAKEGAVKTDFAAYYELSSMPPEKLAQTDLRTYRKLGDSDLKHFAGVQRAVLNKETPDAVRLPAQLKTAHDEMGWGNAPAQRKKKGMFDQYVTEAVIAEEAATGKKLNDDAREKIIRKAMVTKDGGWFGADAQFYEIAGKPEKLPEFVAKVEDPAQAVLLIPKPTRDKIEAGFRKRGVQVPAAADIVAVYKKGYGL